MIQTVINNWRVLLVYTIYLVSLLVYSFALIDPNLTLINHPLWETFRNTAVQFGYLNRYDSWHTYIVLIVIGFIVHKEIQKTSLSPLKLALLTAGILVASYPFLSHDLFNYMFDARIFTHYGANPYTHIPADFASDPWLRFMHWTHRPYPYGPVFLVLSILASFIGFGKLILNFLLFKGLAAIAYVITVWAASRLKPSWGRYIATHPLIIIEGLVNAHNDMIAVALGMYGVYLLSKSSHTITAIAARLSLLSSGGIKFFTLPLILLNKPKGNSRLNTLGLGLMVVLLITASITGSIQQWYALNLFLIVPYAFKHIQNSEIMFAGLLLSYFPFIRYGEWIAYEGMDVKTIIICVALGIWLPYLALSAHKKIDH